MKQIKTLFSAASWVGIGILCLHLLCAQALAAEEVPAWRGTYDLVMRIVNFLILAVVIFKFGKKPIMSFLHGEKDKLAHEIQTLEDEKDKTVAKVNAALADLEDSKTRFEKLKEKIITQGEKEKQAIIEDAKQQSQTLLEGSKAKIEGQFRAAKNAFQAELVDAAMALAMEKLPNLMTEEDNRKMVDDYLANAAL